MQSKRWLDPTLRLRLKWIHLFGLVLGPRTFQLMRRSLAGNL